MARGVWYPNPREIWQQGAAARVVVRYEAWGARVRW